ncbi:MAG: pilus assembly protein PilM, partial [Methylobacter sp.]|nr:pilus assembly protein PilM [Methylobacter sp.]
MQLLQKLLGKKLQNNGFVGISYLPDGIAVAVSNYVDNNKLRLNYCEFISILNVNDQPELLRDLVTRYHLVNYDCHLLLTADNYRRINIEAPAVADDEMSQAIRWKISDLIDFSIDKAVIDYYPVPVSMRATSTNMLEVVVSPQELIKELADKSTHAGLQLKVIDIQETVLRNLAVLLPENQRGVAVLMLHESSGTILIQKEGRIYLSRNFDIGYRDLGLASYNSGNDTQNSIEQNNLALEIQRSLDYVESYYNMPPISGLAVIPLAENTQQLLNILNDN